MNPLAFHEIIEADHHILDPFTVEKLALVGEICLPRNGMRVLDLACGKAELLARWARAHAITGTGVDLSETFLAAARNRIAELGVTDRIDLVQGDAGAYVADAAAYDVACCVGATWIGGGLVGTIELLRGAVRPDGLLVVGEPYWSEPPPGGACTALQVRADEFATLDGTLDRFESAGVELVEMVLADGDSWDRYCAAQWRTGDRWLAANTEHPDAAEVRDLLRGARRSYLEYGRRYLGWGVFVLRPARW